MRIRNQKLAIALGCVSLLVGCSPSHEDIDKGGRGGSSGAPLGQGGKSGRSGDKLGGQGGHLHGSEESGGQGPGDPNDSILVWTWNLEMFPLTQQTPKLVADIIEQNRPTIVGVEEVADVAAFAQMEDLLPGYESLTLDDPTEFQQQGLLYDNRRLAVSDAELLFEDDSYAFPRPALKVVVHPLGAAEDNGFTLVVLHLKANGEQESVDRRKAAIVKLKAWLDTPLGLGTRQGLQTQVLVMGDFNDKLTEPREANVFQPLLDDKSKYEFLTQTLSEGLDEGTFIPFESFIDHQLATRDMRERYVESSIDVIELDKTVSDYTETVSDHRPVAARFYWP